MSESDVGWTILGDAARHKGHRMLRVRCGCGLERDIRAVHVETRVSSRCEACRIKTKRKRAESERPSKTVRTVSGCLEWTGKRTRAGYGVFVVNGKEFYAHRDALERKLGRELVAGECACHHCDNPPCVDPDHLFAGTQADNARDMWKKGRGSKPPNRRAIRAGEIGAVLPKRRGKAA